MKTKTDRPEKDGQQNQHDKFITFSEKSHRGLAEHFLKSLSGWWVPALVYWRGDFYRWKNFDQRWHSLESDALRRELFLWLDKSPIVTKTGDKIPATKALLDNVFDIVRLLSLQPSAMDAPFEFFQTPGEAESLPMGEYVVLESGILNIKSRTETSPDQSVFAPNVLPFYFEPDAECPEWMGFLSSLWPGDTESIRLLRQWFGYAISGDTSKQKIFFMIGKPRSGKGTILRVLSSLMGKGNVAAFSLGELGNAFGLEHLSNKTLAIAADARLDGSSNQAVITERLLSISGEDQIPINRKNKVTLTRKIQARLILVTNEVPKLTDASGAVVSRLLILKLEESFLGREDFGLSDRLAEELSGIFNWALAGLDDLNESGRFIEPESSKEVRDGAERLASPVLAFVRDTCLIGAAYQVLKSDLFPAWQTWAERNNQHAGSYEIFAKNLMAACRVKAIRPRNGGGDSTRSHLWRGIGICSPGQGGPEPGHGYDTSKNPDSTCSGQGGHGGHGLSSNQSIKNKGNDMHTGGETEGEIHLSTLTAQHQSQKHPDRTTDQTLTGHLTATGNVNDIPIEEEA